MTRPPPQATLLNLLLRSYLRDNLYDQAQKLVAKTSFPEDASNSQLVRFLYYHGAHLADAQGGRPRR